MTKIQKGFRLNSWSMVLLAGLMDFVSTGFFFYSYGVFFPLVSADFDLSRSVTSLGLSIFFITVATFSTKVGTLISQYGLRFIFTLGSVIFGLGLGVMSLATNALSLLPGLLIAAIGAAAMGQIAPARLVANWFFRRRGTAMGLATVGISLSGVVMPLVAASLLQFLNWREVLQIYALFTIVFMVPISWFCTRPNPEAYGFTPDGVEGTPTMNNSAVKKVNRRYFLAFIANPTTWLLSILFASLFCSISTILTHMVPLAKDQGMTLTEGGQLLALCALFAVAGKVFFGNLADRYSNTLLILTLIGLQITGAALLIFEWNWDVRLTVGAVLFGIGYGGAVPLQNILFAKAYGGSMTVALGLTRPLMIPIQIIGPPLAGVIFDLTGSYHWAFGQMVFFLGLAALCAILMTKFQRHQVPPALASRRR